MFENSLLPPTATKTGRLLEEVRKIPGEVRDVIPKIGTAKRDILPATIPFLIYEYSLEEVMPYLKDPLRALSEGRLWQRIRGTPDAIEMALAWVDYVAQIEADPADTWWDLFQIGLDGVPADFEADLERIIGLTRLSKASHEDVIRVYSGYDRRALKINAGTINGPYLINDWSGRWVKEGWPKLSFGHDLTEVGSYDLEEVVSHEIVPTSFISYSSSKSGFIINRDILNGPEILNEATFSTSVLETERIEYSQVFSEDEGWPLGPWHELPYGEPSPSSVSILTTEYQ
jgi:hypothetical protein